jgi:hypothetical protein
MAMAGGVLEKNAAPLLSSWYHQTNGYQSIIPESKCKQLQINNVLTCV